MTETDGFDLLNKNLMTRRIPILLYYFTFVFLTSGTIVRYSK